MAPDSWKALGLAPGSSVKEIKEAYRAKVKLLHPDLNPADPQSGRRMAALNRAYRHLMEAQQKENRSDRLFGKQTGGKVVFNRYPCKTQAVSPTDLWRVQDRQDKLGRLVGTIIILLTVFAPVATLWAASVVFSPEINRFSGDLRAASERRQIHSMAQQARGVPHAVIPRDDGTLVVIPLRAAPAHPATKN